MTTIEVWHADSLAGPMSEMKKAFEEKNCEVIVNLTSGRSRELADRILKGDTCDVFAPSDPDVVEFLFGKRAGDQEAASWYVAFSTNELVLITGKGNPLGLKRIADTAGEGIVLARVDSESDLATRRTIEFVTRAAAEEGSSHLSQRIIDRALRQKTIPDVLAAVTSGRANAGIVYRSAALTVASHVEIILFPATVNLSDSIMNVATIPGTAENQQAAENFINFLLSAEGREILNHAGQPSIVPSIWVRQENREEDS